VDRMHNGPRTQYNRELVAQGIGNTVCGVLGALPMTAVIVRSSTNVRAGAKTKVSRVLHGVWLLVFAAALPAVLGVIPVAALAGVLVHAGVKLLPARQIMPLWRDHRSEAVILAVTAVAIVAISMFEGVLIGLVLAVAKSAWETSHLQVDVRSGSAVRPADSGGAGDGDEAADTDGEGTPGALHVTVTGNATFLRLPKLLDALEALPTDRPIELDLDGLRHLDHACRTALTAWTQRHNTQAAHPVRVVAGRLALTAETAG